MKHIVSGFAASLTSMNLKHRQNPKDILSQFVLILLPKCQVGFNTRFNSVSQNCSLCHSVCLYSMSASSYFHFMIAAVVSRVMCCDSGKRIKTVIKQRAFPRSRLNVG